MVRRLPLVLVLVLTLAACGGSSKVNAQQQITTNYEKFFSSKTSLSDRVGLLENGSKFKSVIQSFASNPLASNTSAKVFSVTLQGASNAKVVYEVKVAGAVVPPGKQTGAAVLQSGVWKVGDASLCKLIALGGSIPAVCKKS
jgi:hypothetical protein